MKPRIPIVAFVLAAVLTAAAAEPNPSRSPKTLPPIKLHYEAPHWLIIRADHIPGREIRINYLEAYCRAGSTDADWDRHTVIPHRTEVLELAADRESLRLRDTLDDGVTVEHLITARADGVDFRLTAHNPGPERSEAHWAQPCVRLADFTGFDSQGSDLNDYLPKCFIFLDSQLTRLSDVRPWATQARYTPGQTWCPADVPRTDVNPRPLSPLVPSNGLIGAFSADERWIFATAWEPYQELFQGIIRCLHSDFRLGGLRPGETKRVRGRIYIVANDVPALLARYATDFPEHHAGPTAHASSPSGIPGATSLSNPAITYRVPDKPYVVLRRGDLEAVIVDNRAVDDDVLPGHAAGYHGVAALRHARQPRSLFVPRYAGLNFEHIHDGTVQPREVLFEPRHAPMELRVIDEHTAELYQRATPHWGLESCMRYTLLPNGVIELLFECAPHRNTFTNGYIGLFWASYIDRPESLDIHFRGSTDSSNDPPRWQRGVTPAHGTFATHRPVADQRHFPYDPAFPLELPFGFSPIRYSEPWYFGVCRGMAFAQIFRAADSVWFSQSPSGGGTGCPAWDFQWLIPKPTLGKRYQLTMHAGYWSLDESHNLGAIRDRVLELMAQPQAVLNLTAPGTAARASEARPRNGVGPIPSARAIAFYYPWYGNPQTDGRYANWNHPVAVRNEPPRTYPGGDDIGANFYPALGCYSVNDPVTLREHMRQLRRAGIGVICASWWGRDTFTDRALPGLFEAAEKAGLFVSLHLEPFPGRNAVTTRDAMVYLIDRFGDSPALHRLPRLNNRPVFFVYDSYLTDAEEWASILQPGGTRSIRGTREDAVVIGLWVKEGDGAFMAEGGFDGFYTYFATDGFTYGSTLANWPQLAAWARANEKLFVPCVAPGYIDTRIRPWNFLNTRAREQGAYYDRMWTAALALAPELVAITSFNEWHEGTQIEPAIPHQTSGFTYLDYQPLPPDHYLDRTAHWVQALTNPQPIGTR
jgi:glycoprotein endo-alpha-1,2-mannosidase